MMRSVVAASFAILGCSDSSSALDAGDASPAIDAYDPNPCQMVDQAYYARCTPGALPAIAGTWTASGTHRDFHGSPRGALSLTLEFTTTTRPGCFDVAASPVAPPAGQWPDPNGAWYVDTTLATLRKDIGDLAVFWDVCVDSTGQLVVSARSGYHGTHTAYEWQEEFTGVFAR